MTGNSAHFLKFILSVWEHAPTIVICARRIVNEELHVQILEAVLRECGRGNISYQAIALESLGKILTSSAYKSNYFEDIYNKLKIIILKVIRILRKKNRGNKKCY